TQNQPSTFKISFIGQDKIIYHYELVATTDYIVEEILYSTAPGKGVIFHRTTDPEKKISVIDIKNRAQMKNDDKNTLSNSTLWNSTVIATYDSLNIESEVLDTIVHWVEHTLMLPVDPKTNLKQYISERIENEKINKSQVIQFMKEADFCVSDLVFKKAVLSEDEIDLADKLKDADEPAAKDFLERLL
ncbi:hypothetical protein VXE43_19210, partial [Acinetobacter baumannii]|uniref:hypothetical protein n=1 Tax=Acinetobacter baumannii TaxID=470 RepID=UPI0030FB57A4